MLKIKLTLPPSAPPPPFMACLTAIGASCCNLGSDYSNLITVAAGLLYGPHLMLAWARLSYLLAVSLLLCCVVDEQRGGNLEASACFLAACQLHSSTERDHRKNEAIRITINPQEAIVGYRRSNRRFNNLLKYGSQT